ncbi:MAG TPA: hypothetical protein ENO06_00335 [Methanolinea sp.]|nr:hypothetical protein [Methanolinea sp.]
MPHKCVKCGKIYPDSSSEIFEGCEQCGGRKFLYVASESTRRKIPERIPSVEPRSDTKEDTGDSEEVGEDLYNRVESIRIVSPGTYELNIEKLAESGERVVGFGKGGSYGVDLLSMMKSKKKKREKK